MEVFISRNLSNLYLMNVIMIKFMKTEIMMRFCSHITPIDYRKRKSRENIKLFINYQEIFSSMKLDKTTMLSKDIISTLKLTALI